MCVSPRTYHALALVLGAGALACGGGGGGGGGGAEAVVPPLPEALVLVPPSATSAPVAGPADAFGPDTDYVQDPLHARVYDPALAPASAIDGLLAALGAGAPEGLVAGPWLAQLRDRTLPWEPGAPARARDDVRGRSAARGAPRFALWALDATPLAEGRALELWSEAGPTPAAERWRVSADTGPGDASRLLGDVVLQALRVPVGASSPAQATAAAAFEAGAEGGVASWTLFLADGDLAAVPAPGERAFEVRARVTSDGAAGAAKVHVRERYDDGGGDSGVLFSEHLFAFDATRVTRRVDGVVSRLRRGNPLEYVWRYRLYRADGARAGERADVPQGFGLRTVDDDYGWFDPLGAWLPDGVDVADGEALTRDVFGEPAEGGAYTASRERGRLLRLSREELPLEEVEGLAMEWLVLDPGTGSTERSLVVWDGFEWTRTGVVDPLTGALTPVEPPEVIDVAALGWLRLWSDALGGLVGHAFGDAFVSVYAAETLDPTDPLLAASGSLELFGLVDAPRAELTTAQVEAGDLWLPDAPDPGQAARYVFDGAAGTLLLDVDGDGTNLRPVELVGAPPAGGAYLWGIRSGPLVRDPGTLGATADVWREDEVFVWETGPNGWNRSFALLDALGEQVPRERELRFVYTHGTEADRNADPSRDGRTFVLEYRGDGELVGFPREPVDLDGDGVPDRYLPAVNLRDGVVLVDGKGERWVVRAVELEQRLRPASTGPSIVPASDLLLPDAGALVAPPVSQPPAVPDAPRVVER